MNFKKILLIALILNLVISLIPIPHKTFRGTECPGYCYEYMPSYGYPIPFLTSNGLNSPIGALDTEILYAPYGIGIIIVFLIFLVNGFIIACVIKILDFIYRKIKRAGNN